ncbi:hypothetical protein MIR68_007056 [Amoeboaphelidium protococcarum]|nr:hypothetical protein MIR68_007056 [Amoeboaphelidium protococcarum]
MTLALDMPSVEDQLLTLESLDSFAQFLPQQQQNGLMSMNFDQSANTYTDRRGQMNVAGDDNEDGPMNDDRQQSPSASDRKSRRATSSGVGSGSNNNGKKRSISDKRAEQNRQAQRTFRVRKEQYLRGLEQRVKDLSSQVSQIDHLKEENERLRMLLATSMSQQSGSGSVSGQDDRTSSVPSLSGTNLSYTPSAQRYIQRQQMQSLPPVDDEQMEQFFDDLRNNQLLNNAAGGPSSSSSHQLYDFHDQLLSPLSSSMSGTGTSVPPSDQFGLSDDRSVSQGLALFNGNDLTSLPLAFGGNGILNGDQLALWNSNFIQQQQQKMQINSSNLTSMQQYEVNTPSAALINGDSLFTDQYLIDPNEVLVQESDDVSSDQKSAVQSGDSLSGPSSSGEKDTPLSLTESSVQNDGTTSMESIVSAPISSNNSSPTKKKQIEEIGDQLMDTLCDLMQKKAKCSLPQCEEMTQDEREDTKNMLSGVFGRIAEEAMRIKEKFEKLEALKLKQVIKQCEEKKQQRSLKQQQQ